MLWSNFMSGLLSEPFFFFFFFAPLGIAASSHGILEAPPVRVQPITYWCLTRYPCSNSLRVTVSDRAPDVPVALCANKEYQNDVAPGIAKSAWVLMGFFYTIIGSCRMARKNCIKNADSPVLYMRCNHGEYHCKR